NGPAYGTLSLNADGSFNYSPSANFNGQDVFTYRLTDRNPLTGTASVLITVNPVNDAPVLAGTSSFATISANQTTNNGDIVSELISGYVTDVDSGAVNGIAIVGVNSGTGTWQYSINNNSSWTNVGTVTSTSALLLRSTDKLRLVPDGQNATSASVS